MTRFPTLAAAEASSGRLSPRRAPNCAAGTISLPVACHAGTAHYRNICAHGAGIWSRLGAERRVSCLSPCWILRKCRRDCYFGHARRPVIGPGCTRCPAALPPPMPDLRRRIIQPGGPPCLDLGLSSRRAGDMAIHCTTCKNNTSIGMATFIWVSTVVQPELAKTAIFVRLGLRSTYGKSVFIKDSLYRCSFTVFFYHLDKIKFSLDSSCVATRYDSHDAGSEDHRAVAGFSCFIWESKPRNNRGMLLLKDHFAVISMAEDRRSSRLWQAAPPGGSRMALRAAGPARRTKQALCCRYGSGSVEIGGETPATGAGGSG